MEVRSYSKYMRISPKKAREVARILPGKKSDRGGIAIKIYTKKGCSLFR